MRCGAVWPPTVSSSTLSAPCPSGVSSTMRLCVQLRMYASETASPTVPPALAAGATPSWLTPKTVPRALPLSSSPKFDPEMLISIPPTVGDSTAAGTTSAMLGGA